METNGEESNDEGKSKETDDEESNSEEVLEEFLDDKINRSKRNVSGAWEFFKIEDRIRKIAKCKLCSSECSYWSTVSNLTKHVRRVHGIAITQQRNRSNSPKERAKKEHALKNLLRSPLWSYYKILDRDEKMALCLLCNGQLSYKTSTSNLGKHLKRKHPHVMDREDDTKRVIISKDGQIYEIEETKTENLQNEDDEEQPTIDIDSVFLDDFDGDVLESKSKQRKPERKGKKRKRVLIEDTGGASDTSADEITFQKRYFRKKNDNDSLNQFGKYLISLLRQLPRELSNQLQVDFVKQVMTAQLTYDNQQKGTVTSNGYAITITDNGHTSDHQYVVDEQVVETS